MKTSEQQAFSFLSFIDRLRKNRKLIGSYAAGFILVGVVFGSLTLMHTSIFILLRFIQLIAFATMGWIHVRAIQHASFLTRNFYQEYLISTLLLGAAIFVILQFIYLATGTNTLMALASACVFVLPFTLSQTWFFYKHIPNKEDLVWNNSVSSPDPQALLFRNLVEVRFQLALKYFDMQEIVFPVKVSSWIKLGSLFHQLILDQTMDNKSQIELV
ncbi:MAG TPA: TssN family type VI secretion system protein, partial [Puia sp.]|nr:TssN family type VI secretion system protein [Puia sp.]